MARRAKPDFKSVNNLTEQERAALDALVAWSISRVVEKYGYKLPPPAAE